MRVAYNAIVQTSRGYIRSITSYHERMVDFETDLVANGYHILSLKRLHYTRMYSVKISGIYFDMMECRKQLFKCNTKYQFDKALNRWSTHFLNYWLECAISTDTYDYLLYKMYAIECEVGIIPSSESKAFAFQESRKYAGLPQDNELHYG